jgi:hypothetical protein
VARDHFPASVLVIHSDGSWSEGDWRAGAKLYTSVLRRPARNPIDGETAPRESPPLQNLLLVGVGLGVAVFLIKRLWR